MSNLSEQELKRRHSASHIMTAAVKMIFPNVHLGVGPWTDEGFYQDFDFQGETVSTEHFKEIEKKMRWIVNKNFKIEQQFVSVEKALEIFSGDPFKKELIEGIQEKGEDVSLYNFCTEDGKIYYYDLCAGPHLASTGELGAFKLTKLSAAYWRGDAKNASLTRIYGIAFPTQEELDAYVLAQEEAKKRDHRLLGQQLELYAISQEVGSGLPLYLPKGGKLRNTLEKYMQQEAEKAGYQYVYTPHIGKSDLFARSGHLAHYRDGMFAPINMTNLNGEGEVDGKVEQFYLKPMNCPMHHMIYLNKPKSYRDLPYRLFEYGTVYRYEDSGALTGLIRVRGFTQNDAHVYCMPSQLKDVIGEALDRFTRAYIDLGIKDYKIRFSLPDFENDKEKYGEETQEWRDSISAMQKALDDLGVDYYEAPGEAAFYGPKIDIQVKNVNGKEDSLSTIQVDYSIAPKFGITYKDSDGTDKTPAIIHMALMGSVDRFMAFMTEMNAGKFPFWIAPEQIRILTVNDNVSEYVKNIKLVLQDTVLMKPLKYNEIRFTVDERNESLGKKIREAKLDKVPMFLVIGEKDVENKTVTINIGETQETILLSEFKEFLEKIS